MFKAFDKENKTSGYKSTSATSGYGSTAIAGVDDAIAVAWGYKAKAKGCLGSHLVLSEWVYDGEEDEEYEGFDYRNDKEHWHLKNVKVIKIDGEKYKPDTCYELKKNSVVAIKD